MPKKALPSYKWEAKLHKYAQEGKKKWKRGEGPSKNTIWYTKAELIKNCPMHVLYGSGINMKNLDEARVVTCNCGYHHKVSFSKLF